ncbi:DMT family transporter [Paenibacillus sp. LHD-117]|uniref:DMT family transporter n=1 Tax=Paenibacillus sp. LHD-117 TaxID=3071412 RepID=UPI0027E09026|nr:DMT family transporter [Paenibacillus sp. LHD-117]MDQ6419578.1 DMT family transporter [Paenibacillus sp. LHD-117]
MPSPSKRERTLAYIAVLVYASVIGLSFMYTKVALAYVSPLDTLAFRFAFSFAAIVVLVATGVFKLSLKGKPWPRLLLLALFYPLGFFTLQAFGLQHASSAEGGIIFATTPILTSFLASLFLKESTSLRQKLSILLSVSGVVMIFAMQGTGIEVSSLSGILLLFLSCLASAGYAVLSRYLLRTFTPSEVTISMMSIGFVAFWLASLWSHAADGTLNRLFAPLAHAEFVWSMVYLGILASIVSAFSSIYALSKLEASKISVFTNLSTVISIAAGAFWLGETLTVYHFAGTVLIVAGVIGTNMAGKSKARAKGQESNVGIQVKRSQG